MATIRSACGLEIEVDDDDVEDLVRFRWRRLDKAKPYVSRYLGREKRDDETSVPTYQSIQRYLLGLERGDPRIADHINGNPLDNRRSNLRITDRAGNARNVRKMTTRGTVSRYKGLWRAKSGYGWNAVLSLHGKPTHLGRYATEEDAALAYDFFARKHFGEYARVNFPDRMADEPPERASVHMKPARRKKQARFKGVYRTKIGFTVFVCPPGNRIYVGFFKSEEDAARAYDKAARELLGPGCYLNFPDKVA